MTTLRDEVDHIFARAGWQRIAAEQDGGPSAADVFWFPVVVYDIAEPVVVQPVVVIWDRGADWEPLQHTAGQWTRHTNHGDVLSSLQHVAERGA